MKLKTTYNRPQYNKIVGDQQRIETSRGCPNKCAYCYEPTKIELFKIPKIKRNKVQILDMNFLYGQPDILQRIKELGGIRVNNKVVYYEEVCGFDYRLMTEEIANELKKSRFKKIRIAWDMGLQEQYKIKDCIKLLIKAGYRAKEISVFIIVNWIIPIKDCEKKLDLLKVWNVKVNDCCYDGGYKKATPMCWDIIEIKAFRASCRKHNQLVNFGIDPELKREKL